MLLALLPGLLLAADGPASVTATTLEVWRQELTGPIEQVAGRKFVARPKLRITTAAALQERIATVSGLAAVLPSLPARERTGVLFGVYLPATQEILIPTEGYRLAYLRLRFPEPELLPIAKCVVAHELVHALTHGYVPLVDEPVRSALREGFADHVAGQVCGPGNVWLDRAQGLDVPASRPVSDEIAFDYGYAETFVRTLQAEAGIEAVWAALGGAPVSRELIARVGAAELPPGWDDPRVLAAPAAGLGADASWKVDARPTSPGTALAPMAKEDGVAPELPALGGLSWYASVGDHRVGTLAFLLKDAKDAANWLDLRRGALMDGRVWTLFRSGRYEGDPKVRKIKRLAELPGVTDTFSLTLDMSGDWAYVEQWVVRGRQLLGAVIFDAKPDPKRVEAAVAELVRLDLPEAPRGGLTEADRAAMRALAPATPPTPTVHWMYRLSEQYPAMLRKDWTACAAGIETALAPYAGAERASLARYGAVCAVRAGDRPTADRLLAATGGPRALPPEEAAAYAGLPATPAP